MIRSLALACLTFCLWPAAAWPASPQADPAKEAEIRRLLEITGAQKMMLNISNQMTDQIRSTLLRQLPPGERSKQIADSFKQKWMERASSDKLLGLIIPIYDRHLTREDIRGLIEFYQSPLGQRLLQVLPQITQESMQAGVQWGQETSQSILEEMQKEFPELKPGKPAPTNE